jgi:PKD repeat protein
MNAWKGNAAAGRRFALRTVLAVACGIGLLVGAGCTPPERAVEFSASSVEGLAPLPVVFTAEVDADAQSFAWDFGDGGTSTDPVALHVYREGGLYTVTLTVVFAGGATGSATKTDLIAVALAHAQPGHLYWIDEGGSIWRGARDGSSKEVVVTSAAKARTLEIAAGKLYWTVDASYGQIERANLDGTGRQALVSGVYRPRGLAVDSRHGKMYWTTFPTERQASNPKPGRTMRANLDGTNVEEMFDFSLRLPGQQRCGDAVAVDSMANRLVWVYQENYVYGWGSFSESVAEACKGEIQSARTDIPSTWPISAHTLRGDLCRIADLVLDPVTNAPALHMYWIAKMGSEDFLLRADPNADTERVLLIGIDGGTSLDVDVAQGALFWSDKAGIHRANLDGTSPALIFPGVAATSVALDR